MKRKRKKIVTSKRLMPKSEAYERMLDSNGVIFGVKFIKKDGTLRSMSCRLKVTKYVTGKGMAYKPLLKGLVGVFDMNSSYRMVNLRTLQEVTFNSVRYKVNPYTLVFDF